jgi:predicted DNA-binding transcriptional regulator YafY
MFGTESTPVELICSNDVMDAILDKFGKNVMTYDYDEDHFYAMVDVAVSNVFFSWVFGFGGKVRINSPEVVAENYKNMVVDILRCIECC